MLVQHAMLATHATARNGLLEISGGGWEYYRLVNGVPPVVQGWVTGLLQFDPDDLGSQRQLRMEVRSAANGPDPDAGVALGSSAAITVIAVSRLHPFALPFAFAQPDELHEFHVHLLDDIGWLHSVPCEIQRIDPAGPQPGRA